MLGFKMQTTRGNSTSTQPGTSWGSHGASPTPGGALPTSEVLKVNTARYFLADGRRCFHKVIKSGTLGSYYDRGKSWQSGFVWIFSGCYGLLVALSSKVISPQLKRWGRNGSYHSRTNGSLYTEFRRQRARSLGAKSTPEQVGARRLFLQAYPGPTL